MTPTISRRSWIALSGFALFGCQKREDPPAAKSETVPVTRELRAGPFSVSVPEDWAKTAVIEKVEMVPVYTAEERKNCPSTGDPDVVAEGARKPGSSNRPQHWAIRLPAATPPGIPVDPNSAGDDPTAAQILIHKADEWDVVFAESTDPDPESRFQVRRLRSDMEAAFAKGDNWHLSPAFMDASLSFECLKRRLDFRGGHGIRLIAQWRIEPELMRRGGLHYLFLGMSDDDTCQIIATFPLDLPGLPKDDDIEAEHLGRSVNRYEDLSQNADAYEKDAVAWLEQHLAEINPGLEKFYQMLESLVVRRWE